MSTNSTTLAVCPKPQLAFLPPPLAPQEETLDKGKVVLASEALRRALTGAADSGKYLRATMTAHAVLGELNEALAVIKGAKESELQLQQLGKLPPEGYVSSEDALRHLLLTVDVEKLYRWETSA